MTTEELKIKCTNCKATLFLPGEDGRCFSCTKFRKDLAKLDDQALEAKLLAGSYGAPWNDDLFSLFQEEYERRGYHLPQ